MRWLAEHFWAVLVIVFTNNEYFITLYNTLDLVVI